MKLGKLMEWLQERLEKSGPDVEVAMIVEPKYDQAFLDKLKTYLDEYGNEHTFQYETTVEDVAYSEHQNAIFFLPKDF